MGRVRDELLVRVTTEEIGADEAVAFVADPGAGGTCVFLGTVRDRSDAGDVTGLTYEAWEELAVRRLEELGEELFARWPLRRVAMLHRHGELAVGEVSVAIAVSAAHRARGVRGLPPRHRAAEAGRPDLEEGASRLRRGRLGDGVVTTALSGG